jgi:hypothetical protein
MNITTMAAIMAMVFALMIVGVRFADAMKCTC